MFVAADTFPDYKIMVFLLFGRMPEQLFISLLEQAGIFIELWLEHRRICWLRKVKPDERIFQRIDLLPSFDLVLHAVGIGCKLTHHQGHRLRIVRIHDRGARLDTSRFRINGNS